MISGLFLLVLSIYSSHARTCAIDYSETLPSSTQALAEQALQASNQLLQEESFCSAISKVNNRQDLQQAFQLELSHQTRTIKNLSSKDRHSVGNALNHCEPNKDSSALVINFTGTGSFEPRVFHLMEKLLKCPVSQNLSDQLKKLSHYLAQEEFKKHLNRPAKWSALEAGPMTEMLRDNELNQKMRHADFVSFPSEESELIADPQNLSWQQLQKIPQEMKKSYQGIPKGIANAQECVLKYFSKAKELKIKPKLIIMSHSSGGRSAVKFLENLKKSINPMTGAKDFKTDLVVTIDPVKEAHHAVEEVVSQYSGVIGNKILDSLPFVEMEEHKPVNVWTRKQPQSLYKTSNASRWINFYQNTDSQGIKTLPKFGIHGSPIERADENIYLKDGLKADAHGGIATHEKTLQTIKKNLLNL